MKIKEKNIYGNGHDLSKRNKERTYILGQIIGYQMIMSKPWFETQVLLCQM